MRVEKGMPMSTMPMDPRQTFLHRIHERPKRFLHEWVDAPAHVHHASYRMTNPPRERVLIRQEFEQLIRCLEIREDDTFMGDQFGYGALTHQDGDRLIVVWETHTEYYSYQVWHIPAKGASPVQFGPLTYPDFNFPFTPFGLKINALDIVIHPDAVWSADTIRMMLPGARVYGSRLFADDVSVFTSFTPDGADRERYLVMGPNRESLRQHMLEVVDGIATIENYYHLILLPLPDFALAVDRIHALERAHLTQQTLVMEQLPSATASALSGWVKELGTGFLEVSRLSESMRFKLAATSPYLTIVESTIRSFQETPHQPFRPLSNYVFHRISGIVDGYQELLRRIAALKSDFQGLVVMIRTRADLLLQEQNIRLLRRVDQTTTNQTVLQHTVEALSVIVLAYYLTGLASYVWKALSQAGWLADDVTASGLTVPVSLALSALLIWFGRKAIARHLRPSTPDERKDQEQER